MPKTRDAFAMGFLYDDLYFANGFEYIPTYEKRLCYYNAAEDPDYILERDCLIEKVLIDYLGRREKGIFKWPFFDKGIGKVFLTTEFEKAHYDLILCTKTISRAQQITERINRHVVRLQKYEKKILSAILKTGLTDKLKNNGNRVANLLARYDWLIKLFSGYESVLQKDRTQMRVTVNHLYRKQFGSRLRQARIAKNMTVEDVAAKINLSRVGYGYYELGQRDPPPGAIYLLAQMFDVSADWLLGLKNK